MIEMINGKAYVKKGDKVYEVGGGGSNFIFANSKEELPDPSTVPENSVGLVPSEGGGGLPVVEIISAEYPPFDDNGETGDPVAVSAEENAALTAAFETGLPVVIKLKVMGMPFSAIFTWNHIVDGEDIRFLITSVMGFGLTFSCVEGSWVMG